MKNASLPTLLTFQPEIFILWECCLPWSFSRPSNSKKLEEAVQGGGHNPILTGKPFFFLYNWGWHLQAQGLQGTRIPCASPTNEAIFDTSGAWRRCSRRCSGKFRSPSLPPTFAPKTYSNATFANDKNCHFVKPPGSMIKCPG